MDAGTRDEGRTLAGTGEFGLVAAVTARFTTTDDVLLGPGDDAAVVRAPDGRVVATTDALVEGRHFRRDWSTAHDVGRRAAAANLADVVAMGARPTSLLVALAAPPDLPVEWALELADGLAAECAVVGATVVGGDVVSADRVFVAVTALGDLEGRAPVTRTGARPGDVVALAGEVGRAAAGLAVLRRGFRTPRRLVEAYRVPTPPYAAGLAAARAGATAMIDVSDGLLADAGHVAVGSGVVLDLDPAALEPDADLMSMARAMGEDADTWVRAGGDDHALLICIDPGTALPEGFRVVGVVRDAGGAGGAVLVGGEPDPRSGWDHFG